MDKMKIAKYKLKEDEKWKVKYQEEGNKKRQSLKIKINHNKENKAKDLLIKKWIWGTMKNLEAHWHFILADTMFLISPKTLQTCKVYCSKDMGNVPSLVSISESIL